MRRVKRSAIVPYTADEMFALVADVESYPEFMPWCNDAEVHKKTEHEVHASLELAKGGMSNWFTTRNVLQRPEALQMKLVDGPFRKLDGGWRFRALGESGSEVSLDISFEFSNIMVSVLFGSFFEQTCNSLVDSFVLRAHDVYGAR